VNCDLRFGSFDRDTKRQEVLTTEIFVTAAVISFQRLNRSQGWIGYGAICSRGWQGRLNPGSDYHLFGLRSLDLKANASAGIAGSGVHS
jgi:hypothetical protein